jgi:hypothetical protein
VGPATAIAARGVTATATHEIPARWLSRSSASRVRELIDEGTRAGAFRQVNGPFAAQVVAVAIDAVQSGALLESTGLSAGDAFSQLGDLLIDGLSPA